MKSTIDGAGRVVIPKALREAAGLSPGSPLEIRLVEGHLEIEPAPVSVRLERRGKLLVAVPRKPLPALTEEDVKSVTSAVRKERG